MSMKPPLPHSFSFFFFIEKTFNDTVEMLTYSPDLSPLPLYAPACFRHDSFPLFLPAYVFYRWPLTKQFIFS